MFLVKNVIGIFLRENFEEHKGEVWKKGLNIIGVWDIFCCI